MMAKSRVPDRTSWMAKASPESPAPTITTPGVGRPASRAMPISRPSLLHPMSRAMPGLPFWFRVLPPWSEDVR